MIELPSARNVLDRISSHYDFLERNCVFCTPQILESHMRQIHILCAKYKTTYVKKNTDSKIFW